MVKTCSVPLSHAPPPTLIDLQKMHLPQTHRHLPLPAAIHERAEISRSTATPTIFLLTKAGGGQCHAFSGRGQVHFRQYLSLRLNTKRLPGGGAFLIKPWHRPTFPRKDAQYHGR